jgi:hypothetical protein
MEALELEGLFNEQKYIDTMGLLESYLVYGEFLDVINIFNLILKLIHVDPCQKLKNKFLINIAIVACIKYDFTISNKILLRLDVKTLNDNEYKWYHTIRSVIYAMVANFEEMERSLKEVRKYSALIDQYAHIKAFVIQFLLQLQTQS